MPSDAFRLRLPGRVRTSVALAVVLAVLPAAPALQGQGAWAAVGFPAAPQSVQPGQPGPSSGLAEVRIVVEPAACVQGKSVRLGDIARPEAGLDPARWQELAATPLLDAPAPGKSELVQRDRLRAVLAGKLGPLADRCVLPDVLRVQAGGRVYTKAELQRIVVEFLTPAARAMEGEAEFRDIHVPAYFFLQDAADRLELTVPGSSGAGGQGGPAAGLAPGRVNVRMTAVGPDGKAYRQASASLALDLWRDVPCAARPLNPGTLLDPGDVTFKRKNLATLPSARPGRPDEDGIWDGRTGPLRVKRPLGTGQPITLDCLERPPLVAKQDKVSLLFEGAYVQLEVPAVALADGRAGERITVRNLQTSKEIQAVVRDAQTVVVK